MTRPWWALGASKLTFRRDAADKASRTAHRVLGLADLCKYAAGDLREMSARAMHYGQSRRSPRTVANGTRGPHRGQGRREMKRGVNSLRQALRPPTSPIHTHSRVSCHCPIAALPVLPRRTRRKTSPPFSPIWPDGSQQRKRSAMRWSFRGRTPEKRISATADNVRKAAANLGTSRAEPRKRLMALTILPPSPSLRLVEPVDTSVGWRCRWGEFVAAEGQMVSAPSVRG